MIKRKVGSQIGNSTFDHKSPQGRCQMIFDCGLQYTIEKIFLRAIGHYPQMLPKKLF